jgi:hypothetical protein
MIAYRSVNNNLFFPPADSWLGTDYPAAFLQRDLEFCRADSRRSKVPHSSLIEEISQLYRSVNGRPTQNPSSLTGLIKPHKHFTRS